MDWYEDVLDCMHKGNKLLFRRSNTLIQELDAELSKASHKAVVLWALHLANEIHDKLCKEIYDDPRPVEAISMSAECAFGRETMKNARRATLKCYDTCDDCTREVDKLYCQAIAQGCSTVHTAKHAIYLPVYELTAIIRWHGTVSGREYAMLRAHHYKNVLLLSEDQVDSCPSWAGFMSK